MPARGDDPVGLTSEQDARITQLYQEMEKSLYIYALSALSENALAEEALQDTFRIACGKPDDLLTSSNPNGWLMETLKHVIRNMRRSRARLNSLMLSAIPLEAVASEPSRQNMEFNVMCEEYVGKEDYRLFRMVTLDKYTMLEASQELGISVEACKKRVQRARNKLKNFLEEN